MAITIDNVVSTIDSKTTEYMALIEAYFTDLLNSVDDARGGTSGQQIREMDNVAFVRSQLSLGPENTPDVSALFAPLDAAILAFTANVNSMAPIPPPQELRPPLDGWRGVVPFDKWPNADEIEKIQYYDPMYDLCLELINRMQQGENLDNIRHYLLHATQRTRQIAQDVIDLRNYGSRMFEVPAVVNTSMYSVIDRQAFNEFDDDTKFMEYVIQELMLDYVNKAIKYKTELDKVQPRYAIIFGEIYVAMAEYIDNKAKKEIGWFISDYEARMEAQLKNMSMNSDHYTKHINDMMSACARSARVNAEAITNDMLNELRRIAESADVAKAESDFYAVMNEATLAKFGMTINEYIGRHANRLAIYLADKTNAITNYGALLQGYRSLMGSLTQDVVGVLTTKG